MSYQFQEGDIVRISPQARAYDELYQATWMIKVIVGEDALIETPQFGRWKFSLDSLILVQTAERKFRQEC